MPFPGHKYVSKLDGSSESSWFGFVCGHCGTKVSGAVVASYTPSGNQGPAIRWLGCPECSKGSVDNDGTISPGTKFGPQIEGLPTDVANAYDEVRNCMQVSAFTAAELMCRKILMHVAVEKGATEGDTFKAFLTHLESAGYVTPPMKPWVALIRDHGNSATHALPATDKARAEGTVMFTAELLRLVYEMAHMANKYATPEPPDAPAEKESD